MMPVGRLDPGPDWTARYQAALELTQEAEAVVLGPHTDLGIDAPPERDNQFGAATITGRRARIWVAYAGLNGQDRRWFRAESPDRAWRRLQDAGRRTRERAERPDRACTDCGAVIAGTARRDKVRCDRCTVANRRANRRTNHPGPGQGARTDLPTSRTVYGAPPKGRGDTPHNDSPTYKVVGSPSQPTGSPQTTRLTAAETNPTPVPRRTARPHSVGAP